MTYPLGLPHHYGYREEDLGIYDTVRDVDFVTGASIAIRRSLLDQIGMLDAGFHPIYFEDVDFCYRARSAGWRVVYAPESRLIHLESATMVRDSYPYFLCFHQGRLRFLLKHFAPRALIDDFVPVETARLPELTSMHERKALSRAYRSALRMLPNLYGERFGYGDTTHTDLVAVSNALCELNDQLVQSSEIR